jgi:hypothetical protein
VSQDALKPTIYPGERDRAGGRFPADALVDVFAAHARLGGTGSSRSSAARLLAGEAPAGAEEAKLTLYVGRQERAGSEPAYEAGGRRAAHAVGGRPEASVSGSRSPTS